MAFFNPWRDSYLANPYPALRELRRTAPVHWSSELGAWVVTKHADCVRVLQDAASFSADLADSSSTHAQRLLESTALAPLARAATLSTADGPTHSVLRRLASPGFGALDASLLDATIAQLATQLATQVPGNSFEVMSQFADALARDAGLLALGVPSADLAEFWHWLAEIQFARSRVAPEQMLAAASDSLKELEAYLSTASGSTALRSIWEGRQLIGRETALSAIVQIGSVGSGPTAGAIANAMLALVEHPDRESRTRLGFAGWYAVTDELLRYDSPAHAIMRFAVRDTDLRGHRIRARSSILVMIGAANRDEETFKDPDRLALQRDARRHLAFGYGQHFCLGAHVARRVIAHALWAIRRRFPDLNVVSLTREQPFELRIPTSLVVAA